MNRRGVVYDTGTVFSGRGWKFDTRPKLRAGTVRRELDIIRSDLHCNAVRITGHDVGRLVSVAETALEAGLEVWLSPTMFEHGPDQTLDYAARAAKAAEPLRSRFPGRLVLVVGGEFTLFMRGIVAGNSLSERLTNLISAAKAGDRGFSGQLNDFLSRVGDAVRAVYDGPITYASLPGEKVDWSRFDLIGVDHYREARNAGRYEEALRPLQALGKPVVVTEVGMRTYQGANHSGALGMGIIDGSSQYRHGLPLIGRLVRPRLQPGNWVRDEDLQARELTETLAILDRVGIDGAFVNTFVEPASPFDEEPVHDLDMSALSLVKSYERRHGTTYPDMTWEPKKSFKAVADFYAADGARQPRELPAGECRFLAAQAERGKT
jgi:hypothetical protein